MNTVTVIFQDFYRDYKNISSRTALSGCFHSGGFSMVIYLNKQKQLTMTKYLLFSNCFYKTSSCCYVICSNPQKQHMTEVILGPVSQQHHLIALIGRYFVHKFQNSNFFDFIRSISNFS